MKQFLLIITLCPTLLMGQITINQSDMPAPGDIYSYSNSNDFTIDPTLTGEDYFWDFSDLNVFTQEADTFVTVESTPFLYQFFFNNGFLYPDYEADVALPVGDINVVVVSATEVFNYYKNDNEGYRLVGIGANVSGAPTSTQYEPIDWIYEFPLSYGDEFDGTSFIEFSLPGVGFISQDKETSTTADGWGQLSLPFGDFEVLRVKRVISEVDSVFNEVLQFGFNVEQPEIINYRWLGEEKGEALLDIDVIDGVVARIKYQDDIVSGIEEFSKNNFKLYPNPSSDFINIATDEYIQLQDVIIMDNTGRAVYCHKERNHIGINIDVNNLDPGLYHLQISNSEAIQSKPFVIY